MALFGKLFEKKQCSICGSDIGLLGNRKLEDGNCCKACAAKLSPWFSERRQSTVEDIKAQLEYREANQDQVAAFHATRTLGESTKVILDEDAGKFLVTSARNWQSANPDVLSFSDVTGCNLDIDEDRTEIEYKDREGNRQRTTMRRPCWTAPPPCPAPVPASAAQRPARRVPVLFVRARFRREAVPCPAVPPWAAE